MKATEQDSDAGRQDAGGRKFDIVMLLASRASSTRRASLMLPSLQRDELHIVASSGMSPRIAAQVRVHLGNAVAGLVAETGQPLLMNEGHVRGHRARYRTGSSIVVPVSYGNNTFGVLSVADPLSGVRLGPDDLALIEHIAQDIARSLEQTAYRGRIQYFQQLMRQVHQHTAAVREEERARIARELHDNVGSHLTAAFFAIDGALAQLPGSDPVPRATAQRARAHVHNGIVALHDAVFALHPAVLQREGLSGALRALVAAVTEAGACQVRLYIDGESLPIPGEAPLTRQAAVVPLDETLELTLYRIAQEALTNILKHSRATEAEVRLMLRRRTVVLHVEDNGIGLDEVPSTDGTPTGLGLHSLRERVEGLKGHLAVGQRKGGGTTLIARLPLLKRER